MSFVSSLSRFTSRAAVARVAVGALALVALTAAASRPRVTHTGRTIVINMVTNAAGPRFDPPNIVASNGDVLQFVNVSGGPHNAAFDPAVTPAAAKAALSASMPNQLTPLMGPLISAPKGVYTMTLKGVPSGRYPYFCTPHKAMGMVGILTVQ